MTAFRNLKYLMLASASISCASAAMAQGQAPADAPSATSGLDEIVVTARRTSENLQRTPVAVTAVGSLAIANAQITNSADVQRVAPSTTIATGGPGSSGFTYVSIRGAGNLQPGVANDPAVAMYVDGVYIARPSQGVTALNDIERIEILRGPQGTLFGRNTTGGAVNILTTNPKGEFGAIVKGEVGNYDQRGVNVVVNVPLKGEELAARFVYDFVDHDGYGYNPILKQHVGDLNSQFVRGKLRWAPGDSDWSVTIGGDYNKIKDHGQLQASTAFDTSPTGFPVLFGYAAALAPYVQTKDRWYTTYGTGLVGDSNGQGTAIQLPHDVLTAYGGSATIEGEVSDIKIKSISAYRYSNSVGWSDLDNTPLDISANNSGYKSKAFSQELQFSGNIGSAFNYITGLYYSRETGNEFTNYNALYFFAPINHRNDGDVKNISKGAFFQGYYQLTDQLRVAGGLRWTWDQRDVVLKNINDISKPANAAGNCVSAVNDVAGICALTQKAKFDYPAYTLGIDWRASDDIFVYAKTSRASKAGGFNLRQGSLPAFKPERLDDVELGVKTSWLDNRLRLNIAGFYSWQRDVQRNAAAFVNGSSTQFLRNAGKARVYGAEFELTAAPWQGMLITSNLSLLDGHYVKGSFTDLQTIDGIAGCNGGQAVATYTCVVDRSNEALPQLPKRQLNIGATQTVPLDFGSLSFHGDYAYISSQSFGDVTPAAAQPQSVKDVYALTTRLNRIPGYGLFNARVALQLDGPGIEIAAFGRNLANKKYSNHAFADLLITPLGFASHYLGNPRTYGLQATYRFGGEK